MQKARSHPVLGPKADNQAPTACMHTVSGSISLAVRRAFHLSLTVLFTIGHGLVFSLGGWSPQIQPGFPVSRPTWGTPTNLLITFRVRDSHPLWSAVPGAFRYAFKALVLKPRNPAEV